MRKYNIDFNKTFMPTILIYGLIFLIGIIMAMPFAFGVNLDINFSGGTKISYSYTGDISEKDITEVVKENIDKSFTISKSTALAGNTETFEIAFVGKNAISAEAQEKLTTALSEKFKDNKIEIYNSTSVSPTIAGTFFGKSMVAILITAVLVVIYVGIRFKRIGGISAALTAMCALVFDVIITFFTCVFFKLQIDANYIAVVLTIIGYSLNDTIVIYDRVRENKKFMPDKEIGELVNVSINKVMTRNIVTTVTTFMAIMTIVVVSEIHGLTSLRTFAIPMAFGVVSGTISTLFIAGPLWVKWVRFKERRAAKR